MADTSPAHRGPRGRRTAPAWPRRPTGSWPRRPAGSWPRRPAGSWPRRPAGSWPRRLAAGLLAAALAAPVAGGPAGAAGNGPAGAAGNGPAGAAGAVPAARTARPAGLTWRPCPEDATAQCTTLRVPVDRDRPYGPAVALAVARRPATDPARRIGVLLADPGGPGGSGVDLVLGAAGVFGRDVRARFDVVGLDARGVARSHPVTCSAALRAAWPSPLVAGPGGYAALVAYHRRLTADCRRRTGALYDHAGTADGARDVEALRAALGEDTLSVYAASYGTLLAQRWAAAYPHRVRAAVLDGVMDHSLGTGAFLTTATAAAQDAFAAFVAWCAAAARCALHGRDVPRLWDGLLASAGRGTLRDPFTGARVDPAGLLSVAFTSFYGPQWDSLAYYLAAAAGPGRSGRPAPQARRGPRRPAAPASPPGPGPAWTRPPAANAPAGRTAAPATAAPGTAASATAASGTAASGTAASATAARGTAARGGVAPGTVADPFAAVFCADWDLPVAGWTGLAAALRTARAVAPQMRVSPLAVQAVAACLGRARPADAPQQPLAPARTGPLLLVGTRHDPATPYAWARHVAAGLGPRATLLTYDGAGHVAYGRTPCVTGAVDRYLVTGRPPAPGTRCPGVAPPAAGLGGGGVAGTG